MERISGVILILILVSVFPVEKTSVESQCNVEVILKIPEFIIQQGPLHGRLESLFKGDSTDEIILISVEISHQDRILFKKDILRRLTGVGKEWKEYQNILDEYKTIIESGGKEFNISVVNEKVIDLQTKISEGMDIQIITIDSKDIFGDNFAVDSLKTIKILLEYEYNRKTHTIEKTHSIGVLPPYPTIPVPEALGSPPSVGPQWYFGDLHVHTGYSSRAGYDGIWGYPHHCDDCNREAENASGYTVEQLRNNAWSHGRQWLTFTDHSYCIEDVNDCGISEWNHLLEEVNRYGYPNSSVLLVRSEEVSLEEDSCSIDIACHLGAQFINTYIPGGLSGQDYTSQQGINMVNWQNGLSIINHPESEVWDWCSEGNSGETGIEIWNGEFEYPYDYDAVAYWVRRLLRGEKTFAFSGSDTHDGILDSDPMNGAYLTEFSVSGLKKALRNGHSFVSNGPALVLWGYSRLYPFDYERHMMGNTIPVSPGEEVTLRVYYDAWTANQGYIYVLKGIIGQPTETLLASCYVSWYGDLYFYDTPYDPRVYYRVEFVSVDGNYRAYTNPIWAVRPQCSSMAWLFSNNTFFVAGDNAYCTDVLGSAKIAFGLAKGGTSENSEGRTDKILTLTEHYTGNLIPVGGPAINPVADEFDGYFGITYNYNPGSSPPVFEISADGCTLTLNLNSYPYEDICIIYLGGHNGRNVMLIWGYGWRGTYAGSTFIGEPANWTTYSGAHMLMIRWRDYNGDGLVQMAEITVEQWG